MPDMTAIGGSLTALRAAYDLTKGFLGIRDASIIQGKIVELQGQILAAQADALSAQETQTALLKQIDGLEKQIVEMETWGTEKQRYEMTAVDVGALVYALKAEVSGGEPAHWICTNCYQTGKKAVIQLAGRAAGSGQYFRHFKWVCPACSASVITADHISPAFKENANAT